LIGGGVFEGDYCFVCEGFEVSDDLVGWVGDDWESFDVVEVGEVQDQELVLVGEVGVVVFYVVMFWGEGEEVTGD